VCPPSIKFFLSLISRTLEKIQILPHSLCNRQWHGPGNEARQQLYLAVTVCLMFLAVAQWRLKNNHINYFNHNNYVPVKYWIFVRHCQNRILIHTNFSVEHTSCDVECEVGGRFPCSTIVGMCFMHVCIYNTSMYKVCTCEVLAQMCECTSGL